MKSVHPAFYLPVLRGLDRVLPVSLLYWVLFPVALIRALLHRFMKGNRPTTVLPACLHRGDAVSWPILPRLPVYLNRIIEFLPASLTHPKWQARCPIEGIEPVRRALTEKRRVLLVFPHFSLYGQLRNWLRAAGLPVAYFIGGESSARSRLKRRKDQWVLFPEIPPVFHSDELADALKFVLAGHPLLIALDGRRGRHLDLPVYDGWTFRMATGPLRIAARHGAEIFPCTMIVEATWRFRIKIGDPVPRHLLAPGKEVEAGAHLLGQVLPHLERHPDQCRPQLLELFKPSAASSVPGSKAS